MNVVLNSCGRAEQNVSYSIGTLQRQVKTAEEKQKQLEEDIRKKKEQLDQIEVPSGYLVLWC